MAEKNNAWLTNPQLLKIAGVIRGGVDKSKLDKQVPFKESYIPECIKAQLKVVDQQDAVSAFQWKGLPPGVDQNMIQRILYQRGEGALFMRQGKFYFLPYIYDHRPDEQWVVDTYGRLTGIRPVAFLGPAQIQKNTYLSDVHLKPIYDPLTADQIAAIEDPVKFITQAAVPVWDYTPQYSQNILPRNVLNEPIIDMMAECPALMRTALYNSTGVSGMRVESQNEYSKVYRASAAINHAALTGQKYVPIAGAVEFQQLTSGQVAKAEEFLLAMQSLDNYRLSLHGLENGGLYQKKAHMLESEHQDNQGSASTILEDRLWHRRRFCAICNIVFGLNMWCVLKNLQTQGEDISVQDDFETKEETVNVSEQ